MKKCDKGRLLIVDDENAIREVFRRVIGYGLPKCRVDLAVNGAEAVESFRSNNQGVLLMDLHMPVMTGDQAFEAIRKVCQEEDREMPAVVFCTGYEPPGSVRDAVNSAPGHCILQKPVTNDALLRVLKERLIVQ